MQKEEQAKQDSPALFLPSFPTPWHPLGRRAVLMSSSETCSHKGSEEAIPVTRLKLLTLSTLKHGPLPTFSSPVFPLIDFDYHARIYFLNVSYVRPYTFLSQ